MSKMSNVVLQQALGRTERIVTGVALALVAASVLALGVLAVF